MTYEQGKIFDNEQEFDTETCSNTGACRAKKKKEKKHAEVHQSRCRLEERVSGDDI